MTLFLGIPVWQSDDVSALEAWANANELPLNREWIKVQGDGRNLFGTTLVRDHDEAPPIYQVPEIQACMLYLPKENVVLFWEKMNSTDDAVQQAAVETMCDDMYSAMPSASKSEDK